MSGFSVFIPVLNEAGLMEANLRRLVAHLESFDRPFEVIVGSNGSTDATFELGRRLAEEIEPLVFFHLPRRGPGLAFREAVRRARFDYILTQDMDLSVDLGFIHTALELLVNYDLVVGSKLMGTQRRSWFRVAGSGVFILCARILLGLNFQDYSLAAKGFRKSLVERFWGWVGPETSYVLNLIYMAHRAGLKIIEVPVFCHDERGSRFNLAHEAVTRFHRLFQLWLRNRLGISPPWLGKI